MINNHVYSENYKKVLKQFETAKFVIIQDVAQKLKKHGKPLKVGNMSYWIVKTTNTDGKEIYVPAYKYIRFDTDEYQPIYNDSTTNYEYGWYDFAEVCRIFDAILDALNK